MFFINNNKSIYSFYFADQLEEIRKTTLSKIICDNADNLTIVPQEVMKINSRKNKRINCNELSDINFSLWMDKNSKHLIVDQDLSSSKQKGKQFKKRVQTILL